MALILKLNQQATLRRAIAAILQAGVAALVVFLAFAAVVGMLSHPLGAVAVLVFAVLLFGLGVLLKR